MLRIREVRLIGEDGKQFGVLSTREALDKAQEVGLDLVLVAAQAEPPVARIVNYGKYKYEQAKQKKDHKPKKQEVKGIKISPNIAEHDLMVQARKAKQFLGEGHKVRVVCRFRARELGHPELGVKKMDVISQVVEEVGKREKDPMLTGREMVMVINPKVGGSTKPKPASPAESKKEGDIETDAKVEDKQDSGEEV
ncbi:MAG: translation initiation factor IF-3 [Fimbriimonadaceae bacterium]|nr:translation initiation factor IF-3 [Fimbriimonadaceae bacterium]